MTDETKRPFTKTDDEVIALARQHDEGTASYGELPEGATWADLDAGRELKRTAYREAE